jgi:uncharacterized protein (DUF2147 family)
MLRSLLFALATLAVILGTAAPSQAQQSPIFGQWLTETRRGVVEFFPCGGKVCGKLVWLIEPIRHGAPAVDDLNPKPELRTRPLCGLMMLGDFTQTDPTHWNDGWIYDPDSGKTYHAKMSLESANLLHLRGYVGIPLFGETQNWTRADGSLGTCQSSGKGTSGGSTGPRPPQQRQ